MQRCVLLLRDVPENTEIGLDMKFWRVGNKFRGIKDIPLGFHHLYFSAVNLECNSGQRTGISAFFAKPGFSAKQWIPQDEDFADVHLSSEEHQRLADNYDEISHYLGAYPSESHRDWVALTNLIGSDTLERLLPLNDRVYSCTLFESKPSSSQQRLTVKSNQLPSNESSTNPEDLLPELTVVPGTEIRFTDLPKKPLFPPDSTPLEITAHGIDQTYTLENVLHGKIQVPSVGRGRDSVDWLEALSTPERELLAELQFGYIMVLLNHVIDGWYQWRRIVQLLASCESAISTHSPLYLGLITVLYHQLCSASKSKDFLDSKSADLSTAELADLFFSEASHSKGSLHSEPAFLPTVMRTLLRNILCCTKLEQPNSPSSLHKWHHEMVKRAEGLCHCLQQRFNWDLRPESLRNDARETDVLVQDVDWDGDEAPMVVQLGDQMIVSCCELPL